MKRKQKGIEGPRKESMFAIFSSSFKFWAFFAKMLCNTKHFFVKVVDLQEMSKKI